MTRRIIVALVAVVACAACTPSELQKWTDWHAVDPDAAVAFANLPEVQADLATGEHEQGVSSSAGSVWDAVAQCESGQNWAYNGGSGYDGGLQFLPSVWRAYGGRDFAEYAWQASRDQQIVVAERILDDVGWQAWPACSRKLGLR